MNWDAMERALAAWAAGYSGLASGHVVWIPNNNGRPTGTFIALQRGDLAPIVAQDEVRVIDHTSDLVAPPAGQEIEYQVTAFRSLGVQVQCVAPGAPRGDGGAVSVLEKLSVSLALPSVRDTLRAAGLSLYSRGSVNYLPQLFGTKFEGRAILELRFYVRDTLSERGTYIGEVVADGETDTDLEGVHVDAVLP